MHQIKQILVDENNTNILNHCFDEIKPHLNKYWKVKDRGLNGIYDMTSLLPLLNCEWDSILISNIGFTVIKENLYGWYKLNGTCILPCTYKKIVEHSKCLIATDPLNQVIAFNYEGLPILTGTWDKILAYNKALIAYRNHKSNVFDYDGNIINK